MDFFSTILIAVGLAMDAFAVAVVSGVTLKRPGKFHAAVFGTFFGVFQFLMTVIGWFLSSFFADYIRSYSHWVAFFLLVVIGGKMVIESLTGKDDGDEAEKPATIGFKSLCLMSFATSIDALAVGVSLAVVDAGIWGESIIIGVVAFVFSYAGVLMGRSLGVMVGKGMETVGGGILVIMGVKILMENLL